MVDPADLRSLFDQAVALPAPERARFLDDIGRRDIELGRELARLLEADARLGSVFDSVDADSSDGEAQIAGGLPLARGTRLGPYEIVAMIGTGGMGEVYKARDTRLDRSVAVKILPPELSRDATARMRFEREARAAGALSHPHLCALLDLGRQDDIDFIVMEYLDGETLAARLDRGRLPLAEAVTSAIEIAGALAAAHKAGIVHRDLKPSNIMLTPGGVKLLDFGLAKRRHPLGDDVTRGQGTVTRTGMIVGTFRYMAPEQLEGREADERTDLFALGVVLYEMLSGRRAFEGASDAVVAGNILHADPESLMSLEPTTPPVLDRLVRQCLVKDPEARIQSALEMQAALTALRKRAPSHDVEPGVDTRATSWHPSRGTWLAILLLIAASTWWLARSAPPSRPESTFKGVPLTTLPGLEAGPSFAPDGTRVAFSWQPDPEGDSRVFVQMATQGSPQGITKGPSDIYPAWSPDGNSIAFVRQSGPDRGLYVVSAVGGAERRIVAGRGSSDGFTGGGQFGGGGPTWSPDGRAVAFSRSDHGTTEIAIVSLDTLELRTITEPTREADAYPSFSRDGRTLAFIRYRSPWVGDLFTVPADGGEIRRLTFDEGDIGRPVWTADGKSLVFSSARTGPSWLWRIPIAGGDPQVVLGAESAMDAAIDSSGHRLAYVAGVYFTSELAAFDLADAAKPLEPIAPSTQYQGNASFSPDGKHIAFSSPRGETFSNLWLTDMGGGGVSRLTHFDRGFSGSPRWSPDGQWIAFDHSAEGLADLYVVHAAGGTPRRLTSDASNDFGPSWSRDGRWIYFASDRSGTNQLWRMPPGGGSTTQITKDGGGPGIQSADGRYIYYAKGGESRGVWRVPPDGGKEEQILTTLSDDAYGRCWDLAHDGIFFLTTRGQPHGIEFINLESRAVSHVLTLPGKAIKSYTPCVAVSPDERTLLVELQRDFGSNIMLLDNFQ